MRSSSPLLVASERGRAEVVELLLAHPDSDVNKSSHRRRAQGNGTWKETALQIAAYNGNANIVRLLLRCPKTDLTVKDDDGKTALDWAKEKGNEECARAIEERDRLLR